MAFGVARLEGNGSSLYTSMRNEKKKKTSRRETRVENKRKEILMYLVGFGGSHFGLMK